MRKISRIGYRQLDGRRCHLGKLFYFRNSSKLLQYYNTTNNL